MSVIAELEGGISTITLDDGKANAYTHEVLASLSDALDEAERDARAVVLVGRPGRFSAGFDLATMTGSDALMQGLLIDGARFLLRLWAFPRPVVVACTGHALAAGALVLLAADYRIGADGPFKIGLNEVAIGLPLPQFAVDMARYRMPPSQFDQVLLGDVNDPAGALAHGFLDRVVAAEQVVDEARAAAERWAALVPEVVARTKGAARGAMVRQALDELEDDVATLHVPTMI